MAEKVMTSAKFVEKLKETAQKYKTLYVMGCFGAPMTDKNKLRYTTNQSYNGQKSRAAMINAATDDTFGFDCVCLIKGILWGWCGDKSKSYGGAKYASNGVPDFGTEAAVKLCYDVSADFSKISIGELLWMKGHVGVYIGGGLAVECSPKWGNGVQITACNCYRSGYNTRIWTKHGKLPYVSYAGVYESVKGGSASSGGSTSSGTSGTSGTSGSSGDHKVGDIVDFIGARHYASANAASGPACKPGKAKVIAKYNGKHPYQLMAVSGGGSNVCGWVDVQDIQDIQDVQGVVQGAAAETGGTWCPKIGETVIYEGSVHYPSADSSSAKSCRGGAARIANIYRLGKSRHPYQLIRVSGSGATVYGWVDAGTFKKA